MSRNCPAVLGERQIIISPPRQHLLRRQFLSPPAEALHHRLVGDAQQDGVVGGLVEWVFAFPQRLSITISGADRLVDMPREELAQAIWRDICQAAGVTGELPAQLPPWQVVRERRATFEATPEQNALRPGASMALKNLFLAGDWTDTGLPATIEGSVRSGDRAADLVLAMRQA